MAITEFIWDFDGTLFDTYPYTCDALDEAVRRRGGVTDRREMMYGMLQNIYVGVDIYGKRYGWDTKELVKEMAEIKKSYGALVAKPFENVIETLHYICDNGCRNYLFSHSARCDILPYFDKYGITECFTDVVTISDDKVACKPSPEAVELLISRYGFDRSSAVMIGDREIDLGSGRNAGIKTCHFPCPIAPEKLNADFVVNNIGEVKTLIG